VIILRGFVVWIFLQKLKMKEKVVGNTKKERIQKVYRGKMRNEE